MNDGESTVDGTDGDVPTWAALFERAALHEVGESAVREVLARQRGRTDD